MIITVPNPVLTTPAKPVSIIDKRIIGIINKMKQTLIDTKNPKGVGLAASQIGESLRIFITRPKEKDPISVFINPEITWYSDEVGDLVRDDPQNIAHDKKLEGCLSIPGIWGYLKRSKRVRLKYLDSKGNTQEKEFTGFIATIIQHETDHLNGILYTHRVLEQNEKLYRIEEDEKGKEKLVEIEI